MQKDVYPPMHSAEHILNQTMVRLFGMNRCFSAHIEKRKSKCDYRFTRNLTSSELFELEKKINNVIHQNLSVTEKIVSYNIAADLYDLSRLPEITNSVRIIHIGDYDACPCSGVHVQSTKEIGLFQIISSDFNNGVLRIRFKLRRPT